jgi:hypothetical protein
MMSRCVEGVCRERRRSTDARRSAVVMSGSILALIEPVEAKEQQLVLIERTPLEEAWENALDLLRQQLGDATANSWVKPLHIISFENGTLTCRAPTKFIANWVESRYLSQLRSAWKAVGYEVETIAIATARDKSAD